MLVVIFIPPPPAGKAASAIFADETRLQTSDGPPFGESIPWEGVTRVGAARISIVAYAERFYARRHQGLEWHGRHYSRRQILFIDRWVQAEIAGICPSCSHAPSMPLFE